MTTTPPPSPAAPESGVGLVSEELVERMAIELAARDGYDWPNTQSIVKTRIREDARAALAAVAPDLERAGWEQGLKEGLMRGRGEPDQNESLQAQLRTAANLCARSPLCVPDRWSSPITEENPDEET